MVANRDNKRSLGITIISRFEMVVGILALLFVVPFLWIFCFGSESDGRMEGLAIALTWGVPAATLLIMGEFTFRLKPAGRIMHLVIPTILIISLALHSRSIYFFSSSDFEKIAFIIATCLMFLLIYLFTRPKVKEQFK